MAVALSAPKREEGDASAPWSYVRPDYTDPHSGGRVSDSRTQDPVAHARERR